MTSTGFSSTRPFPAVPGVEVEHRLVEARGLRFHVALAGPAGAPPLVLLHGWPQHWYVWRKVLPQLSATRRCVMPDLRGMGWSDAPGDLDGYRKESLADDVLAVLDALELTEPVDLVAHDWGAWIGFLLGLRPGTPRVKRYLALNIVPPWSANRDDLRALRHLWRMWYQVVMATPGVGERLVRSERVVTRLFAGDLVHRDALEPAAVAEFARALAEPARARASSLYYRAFLTRELRELASGRYDAIGYGVPTRLLFGTHDAAIGTGQVEAALREADPLDVEWVEDSGHFIAEERWDLVVARANELLS